MWTLPKKLYIYYCYPNNIINVDAQFPVDDMARLLDSWFERSECEYLHYMEDNRIEERPGVSR
jgi:hypothetical protein